MSLLPEGRQTSYDRSRHRRHDREVYSAFASWKSQQLGHGVERALAWPFATLAQESLLLSVDSDTDKDSPDENSPNWHDPPHGWEKGQQPPPGAYLYTAASKA